MDRKTIGCGEAREMIQRLLDASLPDSGRARLTTHAATCPGCAEALADARLLAAALGAWNRAAAPSGFTARVVAAARRARPVPAPLPMRVPVSAFGLAAAATFFWMWDPSRRLLAALLVAGTERSTDETVGVARLFGIVAAVFLPLAQRLSAPLAPVIAPVAALGRAVATAMFHLGAESAVPLFGLLAGIAAVALLRDRRLSRIRRGFHVLSF